MKKLFQTVFVLFIAIYTYSTVSAQENAGITFSMIKKDGKLISRNAQNQKVIDFYVIGMNSNEEVDAFITKFKGMKLVIDIAISYDLVDNKRIGSATFQSDATRLYLKNTLLYSGVTQVIIGEKTFNTKDFPLEDTGTKTETKTDSTTIK